MSTVTIFIQLITLTNGQIDFTKNNYGENRLSSSTLARSNMHYRLDGRLTIYLYKQFRPYLYSTGIHLHNSTVNI